MKHKSSENEQVKKAVLDAYMSMCNAFHYYANMIAASKRISKGDVDSLNSMYTKMVGAKNLLFFSGAFEDDSQAIAGLALEAGMAMTRITQMWIETRGQE